jgi:hypothetical protein
MSSNTHAVSSAKTSGSKVASSSSIPRPSLKNLTRARVPRAGFIGCAIAVVSAAAWQILVSKKHKDDVAAFYR